MNDKVLVANHRKDDFGSAGSRRLVKAGRVPAVIYGKDKPIHITLDAKDFAQKLRLFSESTLLTIKVGSKEHLVLKKTHQEDLLANVILHADFFEVTSDEVLQAHVPLALHGHAEGLRFGGVLEQVLYEVEVESLPKDLPSSFVVDISELGLNEQITVADLDVPEGVKILTDLEATIATVKTMRVEEEATEELAEEDEAAAAESEEATEE